MPVCFPALVCGENTQMGNSVGWGQGTKREFFVKIDRDIENDFLERAFLHQSKCTKEEATW